MDEALIEKFAKDYTDYTNACIAFAEVQEDYEPLSFDRDLLWIKKWMRENY